MNAADKKLLELAAKAIGSALVIHGDGSTNLQFQGGTMNWNPLKDDSDALRLAARLRLTVSWDRFDGSDYATATPPHTHQGYDCIADQDPCAATRRAITRAAAGIGRAMP